MGLVGVIDLGKQIVLKKFFNFHCVLKDLVLYRGLKKVSFSDQTTMFHSSEIRELSMLNENVSKFDIIIFGKKKP